MTAWCPCTDSNRDRAPFESAASTDWATRTLTRHCLCNAIAMFWCSTTDSNRHRTDSKSVASTSWASGAKWCHRRGSNARPRPYQERALPTELRRRWCPRGSSTPGLRVTSEALYAELRGHDWGRRRGSTPRPWLYKTLHFRRATPARKIHKRPGLTRPKTFAA